MTSTQPTAEQFFARLSACTKIQNARNQGSSEAIEWINNDRKAAMTIALDNVTGGIGLMILAGVDPNQILTIWMEAVERSIPKPHEQN